ncbi:hypothetical protein B0T22DRAFT_521156 [Podospora appendiculata]|uniref:DUF8021 domain-containing protein n=1 Tax=Podospora appendiculata TaxID=314037 RepID=A0AAE0X096_9PEZI|nr:hypothetical protein B0T22DRAFT_521156 [Podospora appendiculata]
MVAFNNLGLWLAVLAATSQVGFAAPTVHDAAQATPACTRAQLLEAADAYVAAQTAGKLEPLKELLGANWTYQENNKVTDASKGVLAKALKIDHRRTTVDTTVCATYTELISAGASSPYVVGTQIRHSTGDLKISLIDSVASTTNSWLFDAKKTLQYVQGEKWDPIPEAKYDSRAAIQAAGDAYLDMWSNATAADAVPWGTPCVRLEGSAYTGTGKPTDSCKPGIPSNHSQAPNINRRYVIDESAGSVSILLLWQHMMNAADSHEFRLEGGKLRYVHTMTVCPGGAVYTSRSPLTVVKKHEVVIIQL